METYFYNRLQVMARKLLMKLMYHRSIFCIILSPKFRTLTQQESLQACQATGERNHSPHYNRQVSEEEEEEN